MNFKKSFFLILCLLFICNISSAEAYKDIRAHKNPDGTISFAALTYGYKVMLDIVKVFPENSKPYYYAYMNVYSKTMEKFNADSLELWINNNKVNLEALPNNVENKNAMIHYKLPDDIEQILESIDLVEIKLISDGNEVHKIALNKRINERYKNLVKLEAKDYIRNGNVHKDFKTSLKDINFPQLYFPNTSLEDIHAALIYKSTFVKDKKGEDKFLSNDYDGKNIWLDPLTPNIIALQQRDAVKGESAVMILGATPYKEGLWVKMGLSRYEHKTDSISHYYYNTSSTFIDSRVYWQLTADTWAKHLLDVYTELCGRYNYGFSWQLEKDKENGNVFRIHNLDKDKFPQLADINKNDILLYINDAPTNFMKDIDMYYWLDANGQELKFTIQTSNKELKEIFITPIFEPTKSEKIDYKKLLEKIPPKYIKYDKENGRGRKGFGSYI